MALTDEQKRQRLLMMIFGTLAVFFTGFIHIWSIFQPYVMADVGWTQTQSSLCFYTALCCFVIGSIVGGRIESRIGSKSVVAIGGAIFSAGVILSAFMILPSPIPMYLTYGVMQGFGQGMVYTVVVATAQKWFPDRTGFASGIIVSMNGLCGLILSPICKALLSASGVKLTLLVVGIMITISWILSVVFFYKPKFKRPAGVDKYDGKRQYTSAEMMRTKVFYLLVITFLCSLVPYFLLSPISQTYQIALGIPSTVAISAVMAGSIFNASLRLLLPSIADKVGRISCIGGTIVMIFAASVILSVSSSYVVTAMMIVLYGGYGGIMGNFPSFTSSIFGMKHSGENYGFVMMSLIAATVLASSISSVITSAGYAMNMMFMVAAVFAAIAFLALILLKKSLEKMQ